MRLKFGMTSTGLNKNKNVCQQNLYAMPFGTLRIVKTLAHIEKT
jgi:hypothetical protein